MPFGIHIHTTHDTPSRSVLTTSLSGRVAGPGGSGGTQEGVMPFGIHIHTTHDTPSRSVLTTSLSIATETGEENARAHISGFNDKLLHRPACFK